MATDQEIRDAGFLYIPKQKYLQNPYNLPIAPVPPASGGIVNTNAFVNSSGGDDDDNIKYDNSFLPELPTFNYVDTVRKYGPDSKQAQKMLAKAGGTYSGGFHSAEGGLQYTNSFPDTSIQMQDLNYKSINPSNRMSNYNRMGGYLDQGSQITGNQVGVGTGSPVTNFKGVSIAPSFATDGVTTVKGNLNKIANPGIFNSYGASVNDPQVGDVGFENYSESAFDEEEDKKSFMANMISRAKQIGSNLPGWATVAAKALGGKFATAASLIGIGRSSTSPSYGQFNPRGTLKDGLYTIDGVKYGNLSMANDFYDDNEDSDTFGTDRFDRAPIDSFRSFRTLADYFDSKKNKSTSSGKDTDGGKNNVGGTNTAAANDHSAGQTGYGSCFIAGTKVTMSDGTFKNIEKIIVGDKVKGHKEDNEVIKLDPTLLANRKLYSFNKNEHYFFTSEHPFMTEEGWKSIKPEKTKERDGIELYNQLEGELKIGDKLVTDKGLIEITDIKSKEINKPDMPLYNFNVSNDNSYIADGYVVHNKGGSGNNNDSNNDGNSNSDGSGYSCFIAGTKVTMSDDTFKNIEDIKVGDKIKGHKENNEVIKLDPTLLATRKLYSFNDNEHYFFTSEHPFMTEEGWKSVKPEKTKERDGIELYNQLEGELKIGDKLVTDKGLIEITDIKSKEINKPDMPLYNFNVSNDNSYIADGYVVHNKGGGQDASSDDFAKGGRAGYFFGGRVNYKIGGRVGFKNGGLASIL